MKLINEMELKFKALSINEGFARSCVAAFCVQANPSLDEITDIKTAVSEAVTNCVVHAYPAIPGQIKLRVELYEDNVIIEISDNGIGINDFEKAKQPFYTSKPNEERSGMGFTVMESFMDSLELKANQNNGLVVKMTKFFKNSNKVTVGEYNVVKWTNTFTYR